MAELDGARIVGRKTLELVHSNHVPATLLLLDTGGLPLPGYGFGLGSRVLLDVAQSLSIDLSHFLDVTIDRKVNVFEHIYFGVNALLYQLKMIEERIHCGANKRLLLIKSWSNCLQGVENILFGDFSDYRKSLAVPIVKHAHRVKRPLVVEQPSNGRLRLDSLPPRLVSVRLIESGLPFSACPIARSPYRTDGSREPNGGHDVASSLQSAAISVGIFNSNTWEYSVETPPYLQFVS